MRTPDYFGRLLVRQMRNGTTWVSQCIFGFSSTLGITVQVPVGFATDYASIPRALWSFLPPTGTYAAAAVIHDWLYWTQTTTREEADQVFREAMLVSCVGAAKRAVIFRAVRMFGGAAWRANAAAKARGVRRIEDIANDALFLASTAGEDNVEGMA